MKFRLSKPSKIDKSKAANESKEQPSIVHGSTGLISPERLTQGASKGAVRLPKGAPTKKENKAAGATLKGKEKSIQAESTTGKAKKLAGAQKGQTIKGKATHKGEDKTTKNNTPIDASNTTRARDSVVAGEAAKSRRRPSKSGNTTKEEKTKEACASDTSNIPGVSSKQSVSVVKKVAKSTHQPSKNQPVSVADSSVKTARQPADLPISADSPEADAPGGADYPYENAEPADIVHIPGGLPMVGLSITVSESEKLSLLANTPLHDPEHERRQLALIPRLQCSTCNMAGECPEYQEEYVCAFEPAFNAFPVRDVFAVEEAMREIAQKNMARFRRASFSEDVVGGGLLDLSVTRQSQVAMAQLTQLRELQRSTRQVGVQFVGSPDSVGSQGKGILSKLFGGLQDSPDTIESEIIDSIPSPDTDE